jgi:hypothetical protein
VDVSFVNMTEGYSKIVSAVARRDLDWFKSHPSKTEYTRPYCPGEFGPPAVVGETVPQGSTVIVQVLPDLTRIRSVVYPEA